MDSRLAEQMDYYNERAGEYDDFWYRRGHYALDDATHELWSADATQALRFIRDRSHGAVLELAAGTGIFTQELVQHADMVHAVDASPRMLCANRNRVGDTSRVTYEVADLFTWTPPRRFDVVAFTFWLSHVPETRWANFWAMVRSAVLQQGHVVFVDSCPYPNRAMTVTDARMETRELRDGRQYQVYKRYWTPQSLQQSLADLGWQVNADTTNHDLILLGIARPAR